MTRLLALLLFAGVPGLAAEPRLAVVIDDFGLTYRKNVPDEKWYALKFPLTYAVMPESPRTKDSARRAKEAGHEPIIHFPFDPFLSLSLPKERVDPADLAKVEALLDKAFAQIPQAVGLNNHRSYRATQNRPLMKAFMERLKSRKVYFLDSVVSPRTVAYEEARAARIPAARNTIFLESPPRYDRKDFCVRMLRQAAARARKKGSAIAIGHHYYHGTYDCLAEELPKLQDEGIRLVHASELLER